MSEGTATAAKVLPPEEKTIAQRRLSLADLAERAGLPILLVVLIVVFSLLRPDTFATAANFRTIAISQSALAVTSLALIFPLVTGRFDISAGAVVGLSSIGVAGAMAKSGLPLAPALLVGIALGALVGLANGALVAYLGVNSIITTLGVSTILGGLIFAYTNGIPISNGISQDLTNLGHETAFGIPVLFLVMLVVAALAWVVLARTPYGRYLTAIGSNESAALLSGLPVRRIVMLSFVSSGVLAALAGVMLVAGQGSANAQVGGITYMLPALAAVFLGATTIMPGTYNVPGTIVALFFVGVAVSGLTLLGVQPWISEVFNGAAVVVAISLAAVFRHRRTGVRTLGQ
jgi:ribose transport system permease protein